MAQAIYILVYLAAFVLGIAGGPLWGALILALLSTPLHVLQRLEGHRRYGLPMEDWTVNSLALLFLGQLIIQAVLWSVARLVVLVLRGVGLV